MPQTVIKKLKMNGHMKAAGADRPVLGTVGGTNWSGYPGRLPGESGSKWRTEGSVELIREGKRGINSTGHSKC